MTPPFSTNCAGINVWRIDVTSDQSGADDPSPPADDPNTPANEANNCSGGTGIMVNTYFDSRFCADGVIRRLLGTNGGTAVSVLNAQLPEWDQALVIVNSTIYGGSGGSVGVTSVSGTWENIAIHEFGHSAFGLADEYEYWAGCGVDTDRDNHPAAEPAEPNVTINSDRATIKWASLIDAATPMPTTTNADCTACDPQGNPYSGQVVGAYEGAHYYHCDAFRPVFSCMMRNFAPFCPVCTSRILQTLAPFEPANRAPVCDANGPYLAECAGATTSVLLDGSGSSDADCDPLDMMWTGPFTGGMVAGVNPSVQFSGTGVFSVDLEVSDGAEKSTCSASVTVADTLAPSITAPADVEVECLSPSGASPGLGTPTVSDVCDASVTVINDAPATFPIGDTTVTWTATDDSGNASSDTQLVSVVDTTPPVLTLTLSPTELWPPNHTMRNIHATITVTDVCDATPTVRLVSITSDEPDEGLGDGDFAGDIQGVAAGTDDRDFSLRSERSGGGDGRVYTVTYEAEDDHGNVATVQATVTVPKSRGR
jgi:hypothetical protein